MRAVVQRSGEARVEVEGRVVGAISSGAVVLVGITASDTDQEAAWLADKVSNLRIFEDSEGKMNRSLLDVSGEVLLVSQFTLYGDARRGRRPSFIRAAQGPEARAVYERSIEAFRALGVGTETGEFGAMMELSLTNRGPTTILLDSAKTF
ncbi:MAG TPA: D-aminoacyl-tRNA deacylase [Actinomycetota bacterium]|nr:D-aminoacyl-tRNA deacylase [Actinomycetota bacterium]